MKKVLLMIAAALLLMTQCRKDEMPAVMPETNTVRMTVTAGSGSKTDISAAGAITWSPGDKLYVGYDSKYVGCLEIKSGQNTPTGWFSGNVTLPTGTENGEKTFHFFYLGSNPPAVTSGVSSVEVSFAEQEIYADANNKLVNASAHHIGYGSAKGTVTDGIVTGINVTLVSKVALARFSFTKDAAAYTDALTLSGDKIYSSMTVGFNGSFNHVATPGNITLTGGYGERYVMLVPTGDAIEQTLTFTGSSDEGEGKVPGLESNKFYGKTEPIAVTLTASAPTHEYVDLGLSVKWATCNLGASKPEDYGNYYAWGETAGYNEKMDGKGANAGASYSPGTVKTDYSWTYYKWGNGIKSLGKYVNKTGYGMATLDDLTTLLSEDDAATVAWGSGWRMPTEKEFTELINNTDRNWTTENGVAGWKCANKSDATKYIFLPAAGFRTGTSLRYDGSYGRYWSGSLHTDNPSNGRCLYFSSSEFRMNYAYRCTGYMVRPVR